MYYMKRTIFNKRKMEKRGIDEGLAGWKKCYPVKLGGDNGEEDLWSKEEEEMQHSETRRKKSLTEGPTGPRA